MLLDNNNNFRATEKATRAEACDALVKFLLDDELPKTDGLTTGGSNGTTGDEIEIQEIYDIMNTVIRRLEIGVKPSLSTDAQKEIVNDIIRNMEKFQSDNNYDYELAAEKAYEKYKDLTEKEKEE